MGREEAWGHILVWLKQKNAPGATIHWYLTCFEQRQYLLACQQALAEHQADMDKALDLVDVLAQHLGSTSIPQPY